MYPLSHSASCWFLGHDSSIIPFLLKMICHKISRFASSFVPFVKGRSLILKVAFNAYSLGISNLDVLSLILLRTWKWPSLRGLSLDFLCLGNISLRKWSQTQSPSSNMTSLFPYCFIFMYLSLWCCIWVLNILM